MVLNAHRLAAWVALVAVSSLALAGHATAASTAAGTRTVTRGETLSSVAASLGVSVASLARANRITDIHRIRAGHRLVVPVAAPAGKPVKGAAAAGAPAGATRRLPERLQAQPARLALMSHFDAAASEFGVPADLFKAMTWLESGWQNDKVSSTKAVGIGQLMPDTVAFVNGVLLRARLDPQRPDHNIRMSARFLAYLLRQNSGDVERALSSYYQGLASVRRQGPLPQTQRYVANVLALRQKF